MYEDVLVGWFWDEYKNGNQYIYMDVIIRGNQLIISNDKSVITSKKLHMINIGDSMSVIPEDLYQINVGSLNIYYDMKCIQMDRVIIPYALKEGDKVIRIGVKNGLEGFVKNAVVFQNSKLTGITIDEYESVKYLASGVTDLMEGLLDIKNIIKRGK